MRVAPWIAVLLAALAAVRMPASALDLQSTTVPGREPPALSDGEIAINRADERIFIKNKDGTIVSGDLLKASPAGRVAVQAGDAGGLTVKSRPLIDRSTDQGFMSLDHGIVCDGTSNTRLTFQAAIEAAVLANRPLRIQATGQDCVIDGPLIIRSGLIMEGVGRPTIRTISATNATVLFLSGVSNVQIRNITIDGGSRTLQYSGLTYPVIWIRAAATGNILEDITVQNSPKDTRLDSGANRNTLRRITTISPGYVRTAGGGYGITYNGYTFDSANDNLLEDVRSDGHGGWTVGFVNTSARNRVNRVTTEDSGAELIGLQYKASYNTITGAQARRAPYPTWAPGQVVTKGTRRVSTATKDRTGATEIPPHQAIYIADTDGTTGYTAPNRGKEVGTAPFPTIDPLITSDDGGVTWVYWKEWASTGDNCVSLTGTYNTISDSRLADCRAHGISLYGDHNTATNNRIVDAGRAYPRNGVDYYAINLQSGFSGISQNNVASNNIIEDTESSPKLHAPIRLDAAYRTWIAGMGIAINPLGGGTYVINAGNLYQSLSSGSVTTAGNAPTHTSGSVTGSDGVAWEWIQPAPNGSLSINNSVCNNRYGPASYRGTEGISSAVPVGQPNTICGNVVQGDGFVLNGDGLTFTGTDTAGLSKVARTYANGLSVAYGEVYVSGGRSYRALSDGTTNSATGPACTGSQCTETAGGIPWVRVSDTIVYRQIANSPHRSRIMGSYDQTSMNSTSTFVTRYVGFGVPTHAAPNGSEYTRTDGGVGTTFYYREGGSWVPR